MSLHRVPARHRQSGRIGAGVVFAAFALIALFFLLAEHRAHLSGWLPYLLLLACPLLHLFHGHGGSGHGGHGSARGPQSTGPSQPSDSAQPRGESPSHPHH